MGQRKVFYEQRIPESSCVRKETFDIDICITSRNQWQKNHVIYQNNENMELKPVEPVQMSIYQSNAYRKDLSLLYFDDEPRVQDRQQMKHQQSYIFVFVAYVTFPSSS